RREPLAVPVTGELGVGQVHPAEGGVGVALHEAGGHLALTHAHLEDACWRGGGQGAVQRREEPVHQLALDRVLGGVLVVGVAGLARVAAHAGGGLGHQAGPPAEPAAPARRPAGNRAGASRVKPAAGWTSWVARVARPIRSASMPTTNTWNDARKISS